MRNKLIEVGRAIMKYADRVGERSVYINITKYFNKTCK